MGSPAPDFTATSVFDMEFVETKLSAYKVRAGWRAHRPQQSVRPPARSCDTRLGPCAR